MNSAAHPREQQSCAVDEYGGAEGDPRSRERAFEQRAIAAFS
jgi:hypothetical protein